MVVPDYDFHIGNNSPKTFVDHTIFSIFADPKF